MTEEQTDAITALIRWGGYFKETKNRAYAMRAVVEAMDAGIYPPVWALKEIGEVFKRFLKPTTRRGISECFGCGPGRNLVKQMYKHDERKSIRWRINQEYAKGRALMNSRDGDDAVSFISNQDGKDASAYEHIAKEDLTPAEKFNRAFYKSRRKKNRGG